MEASVAGLPRTSCWDLGGLLTHYPPATQLKHGGVLVKSFGAWEEHWEILGRRWEALGSWEAQLFVF